MVPSGSMRMLPGCGSAWKTPTSKIWCRKASMSRFGDHGTVDAEGGEGVVVDDARRGDVLLVEDFSSTDLDGSSGSGCRRRRQARYSSSSALFASTRKSSSSSTLSMNSAARSAGWTDNPSGVRVG
jgi:hypothetical protein